MKSNKVETRKSKIAVICRHLQVKLWITIVVLAAQSCPTLWDPMNCKTPGVTGKFGLGVQNEARQTLTEFCQENALVIANTLFQQHKRRLNTWASPDGWHRNQIDYILCSQRWRSSIQLIKTRLGSDCSLDHELLITNFRLKLKKVEKTTRPFRYDLIKSLMTIQ